VAGMTGTLRILISSALRLSRYSPLRLLESHGLSNVSHASESRFNIAFAGFGEGGDCNEDQLADILTRFVSTLNVHTGLCLAKGV
jgi:hypothetical protein